MQHLFSSFFRGELTQVKRYPRREGGCGGKGAVPSSQPAVADGQCNAGTSRQAMRHANSAASTLNLIAHGMSHNLRLDR